MRSYLDRGYSVVKMKIGGASLGDDRERIEAVLRLLGPGQKLAVDANGRFDLKTAIDYAKALSATTCSGTRKRATRSTTRCRPSWRTTTPGPMATGENLFSMQDARNLIRYGGMRPDRDWLQFDCALSYGLVEYLRTLAMLKDARLVAVALHVPHGGHQMSLAIAAGLGLGGNESYPDLFQPYGGFPDGVEGARTATSRCPSCRASASRARPTCSRRCALYWPGGVGRGRGATGGPRARLLFAPGDSGAPPAAPHPRRRRPTKLPLPRPPPAALLCIAAPAQLAHAADYPTRPVKWVVPYPPAGTTDVLARIIAQWLTEHMGQSFVIENKPGAGNNLGVESVVNAPPDGYTMLLVNPANGINATLYKNLNFNFIRDIAPVAGLVRTPNVMEVTPKLPVKTVAEFIAYCKANPGKINMASSGSGTSVHLSGELFKSMTGCQMLHVPYKGAGPALTDLMGGQVDVLFDNLPSSIGHIKGGKIRALAVTSQEREPSMPQLPTVAETVPGYEATAWFGIGMPKGTPREIIDKVNAEVNRALADPKMRERLAELGGKPIAGTPEDFGKVIAAETAKWEKVVISSGAKVE